MRRPIQNKTFIGMNVVAAELKHEMVKYLANEFSKEGFNLNTTHFEISEADYELFLHFTCYDEELEATDELDQLAQACDKLGYSDNYVENVETVLGGMFGTHTEHTIDHRSDTIILEFYNASFTIMERINKLYEGIQEMTQAEATEATAGMFLAIKNEFGWDKQ